MKITKDQIKALNPCADGYEWYLSKGTPDLLETLLLVNVVRPEWARWLFTRLMTTSQKKQIAIFSAEQVLHLFEKKYPTDTRPRNAILAAKAVLANDTTENRRAAADAAAGAYAAYANAYAADAAYAAAYADAAAYAAAYAADAATYAAAYAADAAAYATAAYAANAAAHATAAAAANAAANAAAANAAAANAAAHATAAAANAAAYAAARKEMQERIIREAVRILDGGGA